MPFDGAFKYLHDTVRPACGQGADETRRKVASGPICEFSLDPSHGVSEILSGARPSGGKNPRRPVEGVDLEAGIVGKRRHT